MLPCQFRFPGLFCMVISYVVCLVVCLYLYFVLCFHVFRHALICTANTETAHLDVMICGGGNVNLSLLLLLYINMIRSLANNCLFAHLLMWDNNKIYLEYCFYPPVQYERIHSYVSFVLVLATC